MTDASDAGRTRMRERLRPIVESARGFSGWSFDYAPKLRGPGAPWDYEARARQLLAGAREVVDLGTGGGERFAEIIAAYDGRALATEEWDVNAPVAAARLKDLGVEVLRCQSTRLPLKDDSTHLILSRHEAIDPFEVARVLAPGGTVLTQQVDNKNWVELRAYFPRWQDHGDHWAYYNAGLRAAGLEVVRSERHFREVAFGFDELVFQLCVMPWAVPSFDPLGEDLDALLALAEACNPQGEVVLTEGRYVIEARKREHR